MKRIIGLVTLMAFEAASLFAQTGGSFVPQWDKGVSTNQKPNSVRGLSLLAVSRDKKTGLSLGLDNRFYLFDLVNICALTNTLIRFETLNVQSASAAIGGENRRLADAYFLKDKTPYAIINGKSGESYQSRVQAEIWDLNFTNALKKLGRTVSEVADLIKSGKVDASGNDLNVILTNIFPETVNHCELLPDKKTFIVCSGDQGAWNETIDNLSAWDLDTGKSVRRYEGAHGAVYDFCLDKDATKILAGGFDNDVRIWDVRNGKLLVTLSRGTVVPKGMETTWLILNVALSENGKYAAAASGSGWVFVWEVATQKLLGNPLRFDNPPFVNDPLLVAFSPNSGGLAVATRSKVILYHLPNLQQVSSLEVEKSYPAKMTFLDNRTIAISSFWGQKDAIVTRFWRLPN